MSGALHHDLDVILPGTAGKLADGLELGKLGGVVGIGKAAGAQAVAKRKCNIVLSENLAQLIKMLVEERLLVVSKAPPRHDGATAADNAGNAIARQRYIGQEHAGVNGHIVHALFALLDDGIAEDFPG